MAGIELISRPQPHFVPGYTGYCPQFKFRCGETYGSLTHNLLLDSTINHADTLIISNRSNDNEAIRPSKNDIEIINTRNKQTDPIFQHPTIPGYEGFTPNLNARCGQRYSVLATEGLAEFERQQLRKKATLDHLKKVLTLQSGQGEPRNLKGRSLLESHFKLPMVVVRPEYARTKNLKIDWEYKTTRDSPYFMENTDPNKYFISGYTGHVPNGDANFGSSNVPLTNSALCEFTTNYKIKQNTEWAPVTVSPLDPPLLIQPTEIYQKHAGLIPNYSGHVPGLNLRCGKTFGADSKDAKRWLREDS